MQFTLSFAWFQSVLYVSQLRLQHGCYTGLWRRDGWPVIGNPVGRESNLRPPLLWTRSGYLCYWGAKCVLLYIICMNFIIDSEVEIFFSMFFHIIFVHYTLPTFYIIDNCRPGFDTPAVRAPKILGWYQYLEYGHYYFYILTYIVAFLGLFL